MARGWNIGKVRVHVLTDDADAPREEQTRWRYRILSYPGYVKAQNGLLEFRNTVGRDATTKETRTSLYSGDQERDILLECLVGAENYFDEDGTALAWPEGKGDQVKQARLDFLSTMRPSWRRELAELCSGDSTPTKEDERELRFRDTGDGGQGVRQLPVGGEQVPASV